MLIVLVPVAFGLGAVVWRAARHDVIPKWNATARQRVILYQADHKAIREAALNLMNSAASSDVNAVDKIWGREPDFSAAPEAVRAINPTSVLVFGRQYVCISCGGGGRDYGLTIFAPDAKPWGTKELIDGVWYFDNQNEVPSPGASN